ncbi:HNH endonuclease [Clostridium sp.]|uniref:HNH endonuclease n=1 Tax=Clostridium sp. TaxID=1506 RepID=UPI002FCACFA0
MKQLIFEGQKWNYAVSENGDIYSMSSKKIMKPYVTDKGYMKISLVNNGTKRTFSIHRLVMLTHNPIENHSELEVNHKDGNKLNNNLGNLEWCSRDANMSHATEHHLVGQGETHSRVVLTEKEVLEIINKYKAGGCSYAKLADEYGVHKSTIGSIVRGTSWKVFLTQIGYLQ